MSVNTENVRYNVPQPKLMTPNVFICPINCPKPKDTIMYDEETHHILTSEKLEANV